MADTYYNDANFYTVTCYNRLTQELSGKQYFDEATYHMYLNENGLDGAATFNKDTDFKKLLRTVYDILEALSNNLDLFRSVETEFTTTGQAYEYLENRLQRLERRINSISDEVTDTGTKSVITFLFKD